MYLGRVKTGDWLSLQVQCYDGLGSPRFVKKNPDSAPTATLYKFNVVHVDPNVPITDVYNSSQVEMSKIESIKIPPKDRGHLTGWFERLFFLDEQYENLSTYVVQYSYTVGSFEGAAVDYFEVVPSGDKRGAYTALTEYERPHATFLVGQLDGDQLDMRKNPRI